MFIFLILDIQTQVDFGSNVLQYLITHLKDLFSLTPIMKKQNMIMKVCNVSKISGLHTFLGKKIMVDNIGNVHQVHCVICSRVESKEKLQ